MHSLATQKIAKLVILQVFANYAISLTLTFIAVFTKFAKLETPGFSFRNFLTHIAPLQLYTHKLTHTQGSQIKHFFTQVLLNKNTILHDI